MIPSFPSDEILIVALLLAVLGFCIFRKKHLSLRLKDSMVIGAAAIILTAASLVVSSIRPGGTLLHEYRGWPHTYTIQSTREEFSSDFTGASTSFQATYAIVNLAFYASLAYFTLAALRRRV